MRGGKRLRASYAKAITWLALNEEPVWLEAGFDGALPVSACLVIDLWDKPARTVLADVRAARAELLGEVAK